MISLVLPTFNEAASIVSLLDTIDGALNNIPHEIIVVDDDSPDGTARIAGEFAKHRAGIKVLRRTHERGLSSAVVAGFDIAHGQILMVMDSDGQHDPALLPELIRAIEHGADVAIGSRYVPGGSIGDWVADRRIISSVGTIVARRIARIPVSDPLGGFFAIRTDLYREIRERLRPSGFKILLEVLAAVPDTTLVREVPLIFRMRQHGQSKLSFGVHIAFVCQVLRLFFVRLTHGLTIGASALFLGLMIATALTVIPRANALRLLYTDATVRSQVETALTTVAGKQGWLLSDIEIINVTSSTLSVIHRDHLKIPTIVRHCSISLPISLLSCAD